MYPSDTIYSYYSIIEYIPYAVLYFLCTVFRTGNLHNLIPSPFSPNPLNPSHLAIIKSSLYL